jgi:hypothetical protein
MQYGLAGDNTQAIDVAEFCNQRIRDSFRKVIQIRIPVQIAEKQHRQPGFCGAFTRLNRGDETVASLRNGLDVLRPFAIVSQNLPQLSYLTRQGRFTDKPGFPDLLKNLVLQQYLACMLGEHNKKVHLHGTKSHFFVFIEDSTCRRLNQPLSGEELRS